MLWSISFAIRDDIGNSLFFIGLIVLGALVWSSQRAVGGLAIASGMLGFLDLAFAARLGLPPHLSFLALVLWFVVLGVSWWRAANGAHEGRRAETVGQANLPA